MGIALGLLLHVLPRPLLSLTFTMKKLRHREIKSFQAGWAGIRTPARDKHKLPAFSPTLRLQLTLADKHLCQMLPSGRTPPPPPTPYPLHHMAQRTPSNSCPSSRQVPALNLGPLSLSIFLNHALQACSHSPDF